MKDILKAVVFGGIFLIPLLPLYVEVSLFFPFITGKNFAFRIIVEIVLASWVLLCLLDTKYRPKFSWILAALSGLLVVMFCANLLGQYPYKSFWSNFERMDGYVTLIHLFFYVVVLGSVMHTQKLWSIFFSFSSVIALGVALYGLAQGPGRVDSSLGNATYLAVYMLFHIFFVGWLFVRTHLTVPRILYVIATLVFIYTLLNTGTRGTFLGFAAGASFAVAYIALFGAKYPHLRKIAIGGCITVIVATLGFFALKDTTFVQSQGPLARIANISLQEDLQVRFTIWSMAMEGVQERPLFGWGQANFNYVFNKYYDPSLYDAEQWYDRTHNVFLDWLIAGGVFGLITYLSVLVAAFYYLLYLPFFKQDERFDVLERAVFLGLLVGYFIHNLVVFDNIISYIFFGTVLAYIHVRVGTPIARLENYHADRKMVNQFFAPITILVVGACVYIVNVPGITAAADIIGALRAPTVEERLVEFDSAFARNSFAQQEITEQLIQQAMYISRDPGASEQQKALFAQSAEEAMLRLIEQKPEDARLHDFFSNFYKVTGSLDAAQEQAAIARSLSPNKQSIIINQGIIEILRGDLPGARTFFKTAFELDTTNANAAVYYAALQVQLGDISGAKETIGTEFLPTFAKSDFALASVRESGNQDFLIELLQVRLNEDPNTIQNYINLSSLQYELGYTTEAVLTLEEAVVLFPASSAQVQCFIENIKKGVTPEQECS